MKRKAGRPRKFFETIHINVKMDKWLIIATKNHALKHDKTVSEVVREALYFYLRKGKPSHYTDSKGIIRSQKL